MLSSDDLRVGLIYLIGFVYATVVGGFGIRRVINTIQSPPHYSGELLGYVEASIYTTAWLINKPEVFPIWLGLKVLRLWGSMTLQEVRPIFNRWLVGLGISLIYGVTGAEGIKLALAHRWGVALLLGIGVFVATLLLAWRGRALRSAQ